MPTATPDTTSTQPDTPVTIPILDNDLGDDLTVIGLSAAGHGLLALNPDQSITYTPEGGFTGIDTFAYTIRDGVNATDQATVTITVQSGNAQPVAVNDALTTLKDTPVDVAVLANDSDPDGDPLQIMALTPPVFGSVSVNPDQSIRYQPNPGFSGTDSFGYTVSDGRGGADSAQVSVSVGVPNQPPVAVADAVTTQAGVPVVIHVLDNDLDPDGDPLSIIGLAGPSHGSILFNPDQSFTYTPFAGYVGSDQFTYTVSDGRGGSASAAVAITVEANNAPVAVDDAAVTLMDNAITIDVLANDSDPDGDPLTIASIDVPANGSVAINADQTITYTPNPGFFGIESFTYAVADGHGGQAIGVITVTVNHPHEAFSDGTYFTDGTGWIN